MSGTEAAPGPFHLDRTAPATETYSVAAGLFDDFCAVHADPAVLFEGAARRDKHIDAAALRATIASACRSGGTIAFIEIEDIVGDSVAVEITARDSAWSDCAGANAHAGAFTAGPGHLGWQTASGG